MNDPDWDEAACLGHPTEWWFANDRHPDEQEAARHICLSCPIMLDCGRTQMAREGDLSSWNRFGIWGGLMPQQRFRLSKGARQQQPCGTPAAYQRHLYHGDEPCSPCRVAFNTKVRANYAKRAAK